MTTTKNQSKEFKEKKKLLDLKMEMDEKRHQMNMEEIKSKRESEKIHHDNEMTRQRIKSAEIRRSQQAKAMKYNKGGYYG